jgi:uncharacterized protein (DUF1501 family)
MQSERIQDLSTNDPEPNRGQTSAPIHKNQNRGTDHGHGSAMLVSGAGVQGGLYGSWPGLKSAALVQGLDLAVTTDYRQVLAEVLATRCGQTRAAEIFPTVPLRRLGLAS